MQEAFGGRLSFVCPAGQLSRGVLEPAIFAGAGMRAAEPSGMPTFWTRSGRHGSMSRSEVDEGAQIGAVFEPVRQPGNGRAARLMDRVRKIWRPTLLGLGFATWIAAVAFGLTLLMQYENRSGPQAQSPELWPAESRLPRAADQWTLLMFLHPRCACSQASLDELGSLLAECPGRAAVCLVFYKPAGFPDGWERTSLWDRASALADTVLVCDVGEVERQRFGVLTSGQALLYDRDGQLRYRGGLTRARGVRGTSRGRESLSAMLTGENADWALAPVFGCPLVSDDAGASRRTD